MTLLLRCALSPLVCQFSGTTRGASLRPLVARRFPASSALSCRGVTHPLLNLTRARTKPRDPAATNPCWNITAPSRLVFQTSSSSGSVFQRQPRRLGNTLSLHLQPICWSNTWEGAFAHSARRSRRGNSRPATMPADPFGHGEPLIIKIHFHLSSFSAVKTSRVKVTSDKKMAFSPSFISGLLSDIKVDERNRELFPFLAGAEMTKVPP